VRRSICRRWAQVCACPQSWRHAFPAPAPASRRQGFPSRALLVTEAPGSFAPAVGTRVAPTTSLVSLLAERVSPWPMQAQRAAAGDPRSRPMTTLPALRTKLRRERYDAATCLEGTATVADTGARPHPVLCMMCTFRFASVANGN